MRNSKVLTKLRSKIRGQTVFVCDQNLNKTLNSGRQIQSYTDKRFAKIELCLLAKTKFLQDRVTKLNKIKIKQVIFESKFRALTVRLANNSFRQRENYKIIRPLLDFKRESITMVCKDFKMPVYPDQSNRSIQYSRNRIRKQIIPSIKYFLNPQLENSLFKMAELLNKEQFFLYSILKNSSISMHL